jgi:hypothetical protein
MVMGYVAGREFIWRALGSVATKERDRAVRDTIAAGCRALFGEPAEPPSAATPARAEPTRGKPRALNRRAPNRAR